MKTRLLNRCKSCGNTWFPRGFDLSRECPSCRSADVDLTGLTYLALLILIAIGAGFFWATDRPKKSAQSMATPANTPAPSKLRRTTDSASTSTIAPARITTAAEGTREALRLYPELGVANSPLNREFVARYHSYQRLQPDFFQDPAWPVILVKECAAVIGGQSKVQ
jgi:hypothetical protein